MNRNNRHCLILIPMLAFLVFAGSSYSQVQLVQEEISFDFDYAQFRTSSEMIYLEVYYSVQRSDLTFLPVDQGYQSQYEIETTIMRGDSVLANSSASKSSYADSTQHILPGQRLISQENFAIRPGEYKILVTVTDLKSDRASHGESDLTVSAISRESLALSDIQFASKIDRSENPSVQFFKNGYQVVPNARRMYGVEAPMLYFYSEIYNLKPQEDQNNYQFNVRILNSDGEQVRQVQALARDKPGSSSVEISGFNVVSLRSGVYLLHVEVIDPAIPDQIVKTERFFIYRAGDQPRKPTVDPAQLAEMAAKSPEYAIYDQYDEEEINAEFDGLTYIASKEDIQVFADLDLDGKRAFMKSFWARRDDDPTTLRNEYRQDYLRRLETVNVQYGDGTNGWNTDRGRIYLSYGIPEEIERFPSDNQNRGYEVWNYFEQQSGIQFIFVDLRSFGNFTLVHSTARNELQDPDWQRWLAIR